jgi:hypothetical protein
MSGYVITPHRRLVDLLNKEHHQSLLVEGLSVQNHSPDHDVGDNSDCAYVNPSTILFATPVDESADAFRSKDPLVWVKKMPQRTRFALGPFAVVGNIHLLENATLSPSFLAAGDRFAAVTKAVLRRDDDPRFTEEEDVIFVNKDRIEYLVAAESPAASATSS